MSDDGDEEEGPSEEELEAAQEAAAADFAAAMPAPGVGMLAARVGDNHICPMVTGVVPHVGGPILPPGEPTVLIGMMPAARMGDQATCVGPPDTIVKGSGTVLTGNKPQARLLDSCSHGGIIQLGCTTVMCGG